MHDEIRRVNDISFMAIKMKFNNSGHAFKMAIGETGDGEISIIVSEDLEEKEKLEEFLFNLLNIVKKRVPPLAGLH